MGVNEEEGLASPGPRWQGQEGKRSEEGFGDLGEVLVSLLV